MDSCLIKITKRNPQKIKFCSNYNHMYYHRYTASVQKHKLYCTVFEDILYNKFRKPYCKV